jgi:iron complex outermembrane receptor protein
MADLLSTIRSQLAALAIVATALEPASLSFAEAPQPAAPFSAAPAQLKSLSLEQLGEVKITTVSKQPEEVWQTPAAVFVVTHDDIRRSGATAIPELLRLVPGVDVARSQSGAWAVGIRGFNSGFSKDLLVLIDGRSVYTPLFEGVYWDVQDLVLDDIERIEVIRGPGGTIWGPNAVNGVINIITRKAADTQGAMVHLAAGGPINRFIGELRLGIHPLPNLDFRVFAKGFDRGPEQNPNGDPYDHWHQARGGFRVDWQPSSRDALTASSMVYGGKTGDQNTIGEFYPPSQLVVDGQQVVSGGDIVLRWDHQLAGGSGFYVESYFDRTNRATSQFTETRDTIDLDLIGHIANLPRQDMVLGAGLRESPSNLVQTQPTVNFAPNKINNYVYSFFAQDSFRLVPDRLTLTLGSKFIDDKYSGWGVQPTAQMLWRPRGVTALWASVARALRAPGRLDRDLSLLGDVTPSGPSGPIFLQVEGNPNFVPEVLIGWSAGFRQLLWRKLYVDIAAFHNQYDNIESYGGPTPLFTFPTTPYPYEQINIQFGNGLRGVSDGMEIAPDWKPTSWFEMRGSFSHVHVALHPKAGFGQASYATGIEGSSPHREASFQGIFTLPHGFEIVPAYRFVSALPADSVPSYQTVDARIGYPVHKHLELAVSGRNLLQGLHQEIQGDNGNVVSIKREVFGGLTWSW